MTAGVALFAAAGLAAYGENKSPNASPLLGVAVLAADGVEVGKVVGISTAPNGRVERIRMLTTTRMLRERTVILAQPTFTLRRGAIVLVLSAEEIERLPAAMAHDGAAQ